MQPKFSAELIADLSGRVRSHNERQPVTRVKLTDLKKWYARGYHGATDEVRAVSGIANVERHLSKLAGDADALAKADEFDAGKHPRGRGGKFSAKERAQQSPVALALPTTEAEHRALQASNPAYAALTSDVVPDQRNQIKGYWLRNALGTAAGAALVLPLMRRGGAAGAIGRQIIAAARSAGRYGLSVPTAAAAYPLAGFAEAVARPVARGLGHVIEPGSFYQGADRATEAAGWLGERAGHAAGWGVGRGAHIVLTGLDRAADHPNATYRAARRIGLRAGLAAGTGYALTAPIIGTPLDPEQIGRGMDAFSYRTIQKMAGGAAALDAVISDVLEKHAGGDALAKRGLYSLIGRKFVLPAAAGVAAAGVGAGAAEVAHAITGARHGDPYRDSRGRFASRANAVTLGAGLVGAAAGAAGVYAALRSHNMGALIRNVGAAVRRIDDTLAAAREPGGLGHVADMVAEHKANVAELKAGRQKAVMDRMAKDPEYLAEKAKLDLYGGSHDAHYKATIRREVNGKLATILSQWNDFRVPDEGKPSTWLTIGQIRNGAGGAVGRADQVAREAVLKAVDGVSKENFEKAIAGLSTEQQITANKWFKVRDEAIDAVDGQIKAHKDKLEELAAKSKAADDAHEASKAAMRDAKAVADRASNDTDHAAASAVYSAAVDAEKAAGAAATRARQALLKHSNKPSGVLSPVTEQEIPPASGVELDGLKSKARGAAEVRAGAAVDADIEKQIKASLKKVEDARTAQIAKLEARGHRVLAARAMLGRRSNVLPERAQRAGRGAVVAADRLDRAHAAEMEAFRDVQAARERVRQFGIASKGKRPAGMSAEDTAALARSGDRVKAALQDAIDRHAAAQQSAATAEATLGRYARTFREKMMAEPASQHVGRLSMPTYRALLRDVDMASSGARDAVHAFLASPSGLAIRNLASAAGDHAAAGATAVYHAGRDVVRALTMRETREGSGEYAFDPTKLAIRAPLALVGAEAIRDIYHYGRDQAAYQLGLDGQPKSKFPRQIKIEKHVDPYNGGGFVGLSLPDPEGEKGERVLLWGEHYKDATSPGKPLHVGARVSVLKNRANEQQGRVGSDGGGRGPSGNVGDVPGLDQGVQNAVRNALGELKDRMHGVKVDDGHEVRFRPNSDDKFDGPAGQVEQHIIKQHLASSSPSNPALYYSALASVVGSRQSPVLKRKQAYRLLTGFTAGGEKKGHGVFKTDADSDFKSQNKGQVIEALGDEIDRAMSAHPPRDDTQRANLMRAVATVGSQKGASPDELKPLLEKIRANGSTDSSPSPAGPSPATKRFTAESSAVDRNGNRPEWEPMALREASTPHAEKIAKLLQMRGDHDVPDAATMLEQFARIVHHSTGLPMHESLRAAGGAVQDIVRNGGSGTASMTRDAIRGADLPYFMNYLDAHAERELDAFKKRRVEKFYLDDLPALVKNVIDDAWESEARGVGGEWTGSGDDHQDGGHGASRLAREAVEEGASKAGKGGGQAAGSGKTPSSNYTPTKIASDIGAFGLGEGAAYLGGKGVESILSRFFPEEAGAVKLISAVRNAFSSGGVSAAAGTLAARGAREGAKAIGSGAAGIAGFAAGGALGSGIARGAYHAVGAKPPPDTPAPLSTGEQVSETLGSIAGGIIGSSVPVLGQVAGGALGGYLGGAVGRNAYDVGSSIGKWFNGYDAPTAHRAISRGLAPASGSAPAAPAYGARSAQPSGVGPQLGAPMTRPPRRPRDDPGVSPR